MWLGTPCCIWSRARHDVTGGGPSSKQHPWVPGLSPADQVRTAFGNLTLNLSARIISKCIQSDTPVFLENTSTSIRRTWGEDLRHPSVCYACVCVRRNLVLLVLNILSLDIMPALVLVQSLRKKLVAPRLTRLALLDSRRIV